MSALSITRVLGSGGVGQVQLRLDVCAFARPKGHGNLDSKPRGWVLVQLLCNVPASCALHRRSKRWAGQ